MKPLVSGPNRAAMDLTANCGDDDEPEAEAEAEDDDDDMTVLLLVMYSVPTVSTERTWPDQAQTRKRTRSH
jgi:hypothetical protein